MVVYGYMNEHEAEIKETAMQTETIVLPVVEKVYATIDDFQKIEIRVGTVLSVSVVEGADKLFVLSVDLGLKRPGDSGRSPDHPEGGLGKEKDIRQILSGIRQYVQPEDLLNKQFPFVTNLAPRVLRGYTSEGMILAGNSEDAFALFNPTIPLPNGTQLH